MPTCELCRFDIPANVDRCPTCAAPISPQPATPAPMPDTPSPSGPDLSKIGFGALGNVEVKHDASQHIDQKTWHGMHPLLVIALVCVIFVGIILVILVVSPPGRMAGQIDRSPKPDEETKPQVKEAVNPSGEAKSQKSPPKLPTTIPSPVPKFGVTPASLKDLRITFDRADRVYYEGQEQQIQISISRKGFLYVFSVWAENGGIYLLYHPSWNQGLIQSKNTKGNMEWCMDYSRYNLHNTTPEPLELGSVLKLKDMELHFPENLPVNTAEWSCNVVAVLSEKPLADLPPEYRTDISVHLNKLGLMSKKTEPIKKASGELRNILPPLQQTIISSAYYVIRQRKG